MDTHVLITFSKPVALEVLDEETAAVHEMPGWKTGFAVFGPSPQSTCEAAAANLDHETQAFVVSELKPLEAPIQGESGEEPNGD